MDTAKKLALDALQEAVSVCNSVSTAANRRVDRDGCAMFLQTEEWCRWAEDDVQPKLRAAIKALTTPAAADATCATCNDHGSVGRPPDDYFPCPDCTPKASAPEPVESTAFQGIREHVARQMAGVHAALGAPEPEPVALTLSMVIAGAEAVVPGTGGRTFESFLPAESSRDMIEVAMRAALAASQPAPSTTREFTNELGNAIKITIEGPTSTSENVLTPMEVKELLSSLVTHHSQSAPVEVQAVLTQAARDVLAERQRQISAEGYTPEHDDEHGAEEFGRAASVYANSNVYDVIGASYMGWPWDESCYKPTTQRRNFVKATALLLAGIECIDRAATPTPSKGEA